MQGSSRFFTGASSRAIIRADYQFLQKRSEKIWSVRNFAYLCNPKTKEREVLTENGVIAQLVEQRTENPCVPGSIPGDTTVNERVAEMWLSFFVLRMVINGLGMELGFLKSFTQNGNS